MVAWLLPLFTDDIKDVKIFRFSLSATSNSAALACTSSISMETACVSLLRIGAGRFSTFRGPLLNLLPEHFLIFWKQALINAGRLRFENREMQSNRNGERC